jgi:hypothetical protein
VDLPEPERQLTDPEDERSGGKFDACKELMSVALGRGKDERTNVAAAADQSVDHVLRRAFVETTLLIRLEGQRIEMAMRTCCS